MHARQVPILLNHIPTSPLVHFERNLGNLNCTDRVENQQSTDWEERSNLVNKTFAIQRSISYLGMAVYGHYPHT